MNTSRKNRFIIIIILIGTLTQISTDIYTPSLPSIAHLLHAGLGQAQMTMTWFIFGIAITNLIYGPLSEGIGRRWTMALGNIIAILGIIICLFADNIHQLQIGRLIQGLGLGACAALWRSIFRDTYSGTEMAKVSSYLVNVIILSVILAPFLGGYFQQYLGWKASFIFILIWTLIVLLVILFAYKETGQNHARYRLTSKFILNAYLELLTSRIFMGYCLCVFLTYGGLFTWIAAGPIILIHGSNIQPVIFGYLMIFTGFAMALGGIFNGKLVTRIGMKRLMMLGWSLMVLSGLLMLISKHIFGLNIYSIILSASIFIFGTSLIFSNAVASAFTPFGHIAGYAGALYGCIQLLGGVVFAACLSNLNTSSQLPLAWLFILSGGLAMLAYKAIIEKAS